MINVDIEYELSENNYLSYQVDAQNHFHIDFKKFKSKDLDFKSNCIGAARKICSVYAKPALAVSGGVDSQAMIQSFVDAKQDFDLFFFRYTDASETKFFNSYDFACLKGFLESRNIENEINIIQIDLDSFYQSEEFYRMAYRYQCTSPQLLVYMYGLSQINQPIIMSWNLPSFYRSRGQNRILNPNFKQFAIQRFLLLENKPGVPFFFIYSPDQFYSSLLIPEMKNHFFIDMPDGFVTSYQTKVQAYQAAGFGVIAQDRKRTGFEEYKEHYMGIRRSQNPDQYELDLRRPFEEIFPRFPKTFLRLDMDFFKQHIFTQISRDLRHAGK